VAVSSKLARAAHAPRLSECEVLFLASALNQVQVDEALVGDARAIGFSLEIIDGKRIQVHRDRTPKFLDVRIRPCICQIVFSFHFAISNTLLPLSW